MLLYWRSFSLFYFVFILWNTTESTPSLPPPIVCGTRTENCNGKLVETTENLVSSKEKKNLRRPKWTCIKIMNTNNSLSVMFSLIFSFFLLVGFEFMNTFPFVCECMPCCAQNGLLVSHTIGKNGGAAGICFLFFSWRIRVSLRVCVLINSPIFFGFKHFPVAARTISLCVHRHWDHFVCAVVRSPCKHLNSMEEQTMRESAMVERCHKRHFKFWWVLRRYTNSTPPTAHTHTLTTFTQIQMLHSKH